MTSLTCAAAAAAMKEKSTTADSEPRTVAIPCRVPSPSVNPFTETVTPVSPRVTLTLDHRARLGVCEEIELPARRSPATPHPFPLPAGEGGRAARTGGVSTSTTGAHVGFGWF